MTWVSLYTEKYDEFGTDIVKKLISRKEQEKKVEQKRKCILWSQWNMWVNVKTVNRMLTLIMFGVIMYIQERGG